MIKIGDFAKMFDVSIKTVRFYEEKKLLHPAYVDVYTGYRYYDENNINEMSKILAYKDLGFELKEIRNIEDQIILNKIQEYREKINKMHSNINTLDSLLKSKERGNYDMKTFVNDEQAIGKWKLIGLSNSKEEFKNGKLLDENIGIKELYLMDKGLEYWVIFWTKNIIYIKNEPYNYEIEDNKLYLYLTGLYSDEEKVAIYEKVDSNHYTVEEIMIKDNTDVPFVEDNELVGLWNCAGLVDELNDFDSKNMETENLFLKNLSVFPNENISLTFYNDKSKVISYTKGYIKNLCFDNTMCAYKIEKVNNKEYLIVEWKSGDYVFGGHVNCCYVFEKVK